MKALSQNTVLLLLCLCGSISLSFAEKMESSIQEALYLFEMKGEVDESVKLLEKISREGDDDDKEKAFFYLGKIQEISNNSQSAHFYYSQSLSRTNDIAKAYWLAEREGANSTQPEMLQRKALSLATPIEKTFGESPTFLLMQNRTIKKISDEKIIDMSIRLPENTSVFDISPKGIWYQGPTRDSLIFKSFLANKPNRIYGVSNVLEIYTRENQLLVQGEQQLTLIDKKGIVLQIPEKYSGCRINGFSETTNEYILNCTDNALHFISAEDASEKRTLAQFDVIQDVLIYKNQIFLVSGNVLYSYKIKREKIPLWKIGISKVENLFIFNNNLATLEASGKISIIDRNSGIILAAAHSDASNAYPIAKGTLGLFSDEGSIITVDTLLRPLWHFNFTRPVVRPPIYTNEAIYLDFGNKQLTAISPHYYGQKPLASSLLAQQAKELYETDQQEELKLTLDSLFKLEPGNAEGWFYRAMILEGEKGKEKEVQRAWSEAVRLSSANPKTTQLILDQYSKSIGAKFVSMLPISPKTRYPQFFKGKKNLYTIDPSANRLFCLNPENGETRWVRNIGKQDNSPVIDNDENTLVIASGYNLSIFDLNKENPPTTLQLPGKAFKALVTESSIYICTWNGFLLKILKADNKLAWSRKIFSVPFLIAKNDNTLILCNLEGEYQELDDAAGLSRKNAAKKIPGTIMHMQSADSTVIIAASSNRLYLFNRLQMDRQPSQILVESPITSLQIVHHQNEKKIMVSLSDQSILLYTESGAPLWKYQGNGSIFSAPMVKDGIAWIDQTNEVVGISLNNGKVERRFSTPGGSGTPFIMNQTLFSASPKHLLYGFSL